MRLTVGAGERSRLRASNLCSLRRTTRSVTRSLLRLMCAAYSLTPPARAWKGKLAVMQAASSRQTIRGSIPFDDTNRILRSEMIPIEDALAATKLVFNAISGILKANRDKILTVDQIEEIFAEMRRVTDWLQEKANGVLRLLT
jgi:hypothetical protein